MACLSWRSSIIQSAHHIDDSVQAKAWQQPFVAVQDTATRAHLHEQESRQSDEEATCPVRLGHLRMALKIQACCAID